MPKLIGVKIWCAGLTALTLLAGCATSTPTMAPSSSGGALREQSVDAQQATQGGAQDKARDKEADKAKDKDKDKAKDKEKDKEKDKRDHGQPCPPAQQMSSVSQASAHQPCPPGQQSAMADKAKAPDKAKMPGDKAKEHDKSPGDKAKDRDKKPEKDKQAHQGGQATGMTY